MRNPIRCVLACTMLLASVGCNQAHMAGRPARSLDRDRVIQAFEQAQQHQLDQLVNEYYADATSEADRQDIRDRIIDTTLVLIDQHYSQFVDEFSANRKKFDSAMDIGSMAADTAAVLFTPALTKSILAAVSGGLTATRTTIDKNFFYEQTVHVMIKQMEAQRTAAVVPLINGRSRPLGEYSLAAALADLERYYYAGTFDGALSGFQQQAAELQTSADRDVAESRKVQFGVNNSRSAQRLRERIRIWLEAGGNAATQATRRSQYESTLQDQFNVESGTEVWRFRASDSQLELLAQMLDVPTLTDAEFDAWTEKTQTAEQRAAALNARREHLLEQMNGDSAVLSRGREFVVTHWNSLDAAGKASARRHWTVLGGSFTDEASVVSWIRASDADTIAQILIDRSIQTDFEP